MPEKTFQTQIEEIHTLISEIGLSQIKLSSRIRRLEDRMLYTQQAVRTMQLKDGDNGITMEKQSSD